MPRSPSSPSTMSSSPPAEKSTPAAPTSSSGLTTPVVVGISEGGLVQRCLLVRKTMNSRMDQVRKMKSCFVAPSKKTPRQALWLSPLDIVMANRGHTPLVHFYGRDDGADDFFDVGKLKKAMAKALVAFYPFAGRLDMNGDGQPKIDCNNEGVLFVEARSELTVDAFNDLRPSPELRRLFIPSIAPLSIVLAIQVTFLRCGGVALGTAVHHSAVDGFGMFHFLQTWSSFCRDDDAAVVELPCHDRTLIRARSPPVVHPDALSMFSPKLNLCKTSGPNSTKMFAFSDDQVTTLKKMCGCVSTFSAFSALVWRCACAARRLPLDAETHVSFPMNIRRRMMPPVPDRYFGNGVVIASTNAMVKDIVSGSGTTLAMVAARINRTMSRVNNEMLQSAIDYNQMVGMSTNRPASGSLPETEVRMISWLGLPVYDVDFGWGIPRMMSRAESVRGGFVYVMNARAGDGGGVRVLACLEAANMEEFERLLYAMFTYARI